jgi:6-oxo-cyclohex-1-ene-carbonyl-CoA hydrolase
MGVENAMWSVISCETWSAYKMKRLGMITNAVPVLKVEGKFVRNPLVITDRYVEDGEIVYGEFKSGEAARAAKDLIKQGTVDFTMLDREVQKIIWTLANLFPGCVSKAISSIRAKKKYFWDLAKDYNRHWLAANMMGEAFMGFHAFNSRKQTGKDTIDFIRYRQLIAQGRMMDDELFAEVMPKPAE